MYHEEIWINGELYWRGTPKGEWQKADVAYLNRRLLEAQKRIRELLADGEDNMRAAHAEGMWRERQGEEYGSY